MSFCAKCNKKVTKWEEMSGVGKTWHKACFTCGGTADGSTGGCKKVLLANEFTEKDGQPYCSTCNIRLFSKGTVFQIPVAEPWVDPNPKPISPMKPVTVQIDATKCTKCQKSVYKNEEILAATRHWHKTCFTCGGTSAAKDGCNRVLSAENYLDHDTDPYCIPCYERLFSDAEKLAEQNRLAGIGHKKTHLTDMELMKLNYLNVNDAPKCIKCEKVVYKYEEHAACGKIYHKNCFTCGGAKSSKACKQLLSLKNFNTHENEPYCNNCMKSVFGIQVLIKHETDGKEITGLREPVPLKEDWECEDPWAHTGIEEGKEFYVDGISLARYGPREVITTPIDVQGSSTNDKTKKFIEEVKKLS